MARATVADMIFVPESAMRKRWRRRPPHLGALALDQLADSVLSMVHIAAARYWRKFVHAA